MDSGISKNDRVGTRYTLRSKGPRDLLILHNTISNIY